MSDTFLSVIVCTRNRAGELASCLTELAKQAKAFTDVEVVVVDNASTDNTREVVGELSDECDFPFRYVYEAEPGSARARNQGRRKALGRVIAYIDDDEVARSGWIKGIREHFLAGKSDCLAGKIGVEVEGDLPKGLTPDLLWILGELDLGAEARLIRPPEYPQTGNCAMRAEVFDAVGGFNTNLMLYGDDTELFDRIYGQNFTVMYDPSVVIDQYVPAERLSKEALKRKAYGWGRGAAMFWILTSSPSTARRWVKASEYMCRTAYVACRQFTSPHFGRYFTLWHNCGKVRQLIAGIR